MGLSDDQQAAINSAFSRFSKGGSVELKQMGNMVRASGLNPTEAQLAEWKKEMGGDFDQAKFTDFVDKKFAKTNDSLDEVLDAFRSFDADGSGRLAVTEFRHILCNMGEALSEDEINEVMKDVDMDGGEVDYEAFARMLHPES
jgi:calmodulin